MCGGGALSLPASQRSCAATPLRVSSSGTPAGSAAARPVASRINNPATPVRMAESVPRARQSTTTICSGDASVVFEPVIVRTDAIDKSGSLPVVVST